MIGCYTTLFHPTRLNTPAALRSSTSGRSGGVPRGPALWPVSKCVLKVPWENWVMTDFHCQCVKMGKFNPHPNVTPFSSFLTLLIYPVCCWGCWMKPQVLALSSVLWWMIADILSVSFVDGALGVLEFETIESPMVTLCIEQNDFQKWPQKDS